MTYKPNYTKEDIRKSSTITNASGQSPQFILTGEECSQRAIAESETWLLAKKMNRISQDNRTVKDTLEALGFTVLGETDDLFFQVQPPEGWTKETQGYWTTVKDQNGNERITQFFKGAFYDRDAFLNIQE
jgi:hypothetical protein